MSSGKQNNAKSGPEHKKHASHGGWWFLLAVLMLHLGVRIFNPALSNESLDYFFGILSELLPVFGMMFLLLWLFSLFTRPQLITRYLGHQSGVRGWIIAIVGGIFSMGSIYLWYPLLRDLKTSGMKTSLLAAFLYSRAIKIPMLPFMVHYFGIFYTVLFVFNVLLFSVASGMMMERIDKGMVEHINTDNRC